MNWHVTSNVSFLPFSAWSRAHLLVIDGAMLTAVVCGNMVCAEDMLQELSVRPVSIVEGMVSHHLHVIGSGGHENVLQPELLAFVKHRRVQHNNL